jgi:hypothetical protein
MSANILDESLASARPERRGEGDVVTAADAIRGSKPMMCQRCGSEPANLYFRGLNICWTCFSAHAG